MFSKLFGWLFPTSSRLPTYVDDTLVDTIGKIQTYLDALCTLMPDDQTSNNWRTHFRNMQSVLQLRPINLGRSRSINVERYPRWYG